MLPDPCTKKVTAPEVSFYFSLVFKKSPDMLLLSSCETFNPCLVDTVAFSHPVWPSSRHMPPSLWGVNFSTCPRTSPLLPLGSHACFCFPERRKAVFICVLCKTEAPSSCTHTGRTSLPAGKKRCLLSVACLNRPSPPWRHHTCTADPERATRTVPSSALR